MSRMSENFIETRNESNELNYSIIKSNAQTIINIPNQLISKYHAEMDINISNMLKAFNNLIT